jgi:hypothetical protein
VRKTVELPNVEAHSLAHMIVENQLALNTQEFQEALRRLRIEGLSRHDAMHAIASVLLERLHHLMKQGSSARPTFDEEYAKSRRYQTAERWLQSSLRFCTWKHEL